MGEAQSQRKEARLLQRSRRRTRLQRSRAKRTPTRLQIKRSRTNSQMQRRNKKLPKSVHIRLRLNSKRKEPRLRSSRTGLRGKQRIMQHQSSSRRRRSSNRRRQGTMHRSNNKNPMQMRHLPGRWPQRAIPMNSSQSLMSKTQRTMLGVYIDRPQAFRGGQQDSGKPPGATFLLSTIL